eukprot:m.84250 g.84250  ORF g.84250 m.84250 type:complete len:386 (+) comp9588_c2_seq1:3426-4583(+)
MGKQKVVVAETPPSPPINLPAGLGEAEWRAFVEADAGQDIAGEIVSEVVDAALARYQEHLLSHLAKPFVAGRCADMLMSTIEVAFLPPDHGEPDFQSDHLWAAGDEPVPCSRDSWSRGTVPVRKARAVSKAIVTPPETIVESSVDSSSLTKSKDVNTVGAATEPQHGVGAKHGAGNKSAASSSSIDRRDGNPAAPSSKMASPRKGTGGSAGSSGSRHVSRGPQRESNVAAPGRQGSRTSQTTKEARGSTTTVSPVTAGGSTGSRYDAPQSGPAVVSRVIQQRESAERASLDSVKQTHKTPKVSYRTSGIIPVVGVRGDKLPRNSVVAAVTVEAGAGKLKGKALRPVPPSEGTRRVGGKTRPHKPYNTPNKPPQAPGAAKKMPQTA